MFIAVIPARGGSKRISRKNIKIFNNYPAISYSIKVALESNLFDRVIVSTDDCEIAEISIEYGAEVPFIRPKELSDDYTGTSEVVVHTIDWLKSHNISTKYVCCIYPVAPFLKPDDLKSTYDLIINSDLDYVFSATNYIYPVQRAFILDKNNQIHMLFPEQYECRTQDLDEVLHDAGQFYWGTVDAWINNRIIFSEKSMPYKILHYKAIDIDTLDDWKRAEIMYKVLQQTGDL